MSTWARSTLSRHGGIRNVTVFASTMLTVRRCRRKAASSASPQNSMHRVACFTGSATRSSYRTSRWSSAGSCRDASRMLSTRIFQYTAASARNEYPYRSSLARTSSSGRPSRQRWIPCHPFHQSIVVYECATALASRTTWMNRAPGNTSRRNPIRDQPEYSAMKARLPWYRMMPPTASRRSFRARGVTSSARRSRNGSAKPAKQRFHSR